MTADDAPVVAGIDGSSPSERALLWAAGAAIQRAVPLEVVHVWQLPVTGELPDLLVLEPIPYEQAASEVLDDAIALVRQRHPDLEVQGRLVEGDATAALVDVAKAASVLVLGSHGRGWLGSALVGSVSQKCVAHAKVPVIVVPAHGETITDHGRIVVGVDGSECSYAALQFAVGEATRRHAQLDVVHVRHEPEPIGALAGPMWAYRASAEKASLGLLETMVAPFRPGSPTRPGPSSIERISIEGHPSRALVSCAHRADLLVVGARGHGGFAALLVGSVSLRCLHHAPCPLAVVHLADPV